MSQQRTDTLSFLVLILNTAVGSKHTKKKILHKCISENSGITILLRFLFSLHHHNSVMTFSMLTPLINDDTDDFKGLFSLLGFKCIVPLKEKKMIRTQTNMQLHGIAGLSRTPTCCDISICAS